MAPEMIREGVQECEARIFIGKALFDANRFDAAAEASGVLGEQ